MKITCILFMIMVLILPSVSSHANCDGKPFKIIPNDDNSIFLEVVKRRYYSTPDLRLCKKQVQEEQSNKVCETIYKNEAWISGLIDYSIAVVPGASTWMGYGLASLAAVYKYRKTSIALAALAGVGLSLTIDTIKKGVARTKAGNLEDEIKASLSSGQCKDKVINVSKKSLVSSLALFENDEMRTETFKNRKKELERIVDVQRSPVGNFFDSTSKYFKNIISNSKGR